MTLQQPFKKLKTANTQCAEQQSNLASSQTQPTIFPIPHISFPIFRYTCHPLPLPDRLAFASRLRSVNKACHSLLTTPSHFAYTIFGSHHPAIIECTKWIMGNPVLTNIKFTLDHFMEKYAEEEGVWGVLMPDYMELLKQFQVKRKEGFGEVPRVPREVNISSVLCLRIHVNSIVFIVSRC